MKEEQTQPWFEFKIRDVDAVGVEMPKLTRLLADLSSAFYAIARAKIGSAGPRPGRRTVAEETLAALRVIRIRPGSATIELAPPVAEAEPQLPLLDEPTPDDVVLDFYEEVDTIDLGKPAVPGRWDIRRHVLAVIEDAGQIGSRGEIVYRPLAPRSGVSTPRVLRKSFDTGRLPKTAELQRLTRSRRISGHTYMVDVEPGRQRIRLKLPDGRDITLEVDDQVAATIASALDRVVEIEMDEQLDGDIPARRIARALEIFPSSEPGSDRPPKSIEDLRREQRLPDERPDYVSLASSIWQTEKEVIDFDEHIRQIRQAEAS